MQGAWGWEMGSEKIESRFKKFFLLRIRLQRLALNQIGSFATLQKSATKGRQKWKELGFFFLLGKKP